MAAQFPRMRLRRLRSHDRLRTMMAEVSLERRHLILPLFAVPGRGIESPIASLEGVSHFSVDRLLPFVERALEKGIGAFLLFGLPERKDARGDSASDPQGPVQQALRELSERFPEALLVTDVCLCQYTDHGHCGLIDGDVIDNDGTLKQLATVALSHAEAGAHMVAPSDMMDGRVGAIRTALDAGGFASVSIMSYAAKMASSFYGPFRDAADSAPGFGDRRTYQMAATNGREALREALADEEEGADILMVKPALTCLDILARLREKTLLPLATYLVSGERMMLRSAAVAGLLDLRRATLEAHLACRRAGADLIITYDALDLADWLD
ncbi:porphobilinogen synthase [Aminirod propionatiphilus]|uniref:Porphobilinogen synthase n=1 Tax=Aminirod propionatiphilus TaxID=3415223 RepID=A0ACD1DYK0_9BACT|nr:porphobilinogen synthase [Synergistota bacterium]